VKKKFIYIILLSFIIILLVLVGIFKINEKDDFTNNYSYNVDGFDVVSLNELSDVISDNEKIIIYISNQNSKFDCQMIDILRNYKGKFNIKVFEITEIEEDSLEYDFYKEIIDSADKIYKKENNNNDVSIINTTPTLVLFKNGNVKNVLVGVKSDKYIYKWLNKNY